MLSMHKSAMQALTMAHALSYLYDAMISKNAAICHASLSIWCAVCRKRTMKNKKRKEQKHKTFSKVHGVRFFIDTHIVRTHTGDLHTFNRPNQNQQPNAYHIAPVEWDEKHIFFCENMSMLHVHIALK